MYEKRKRQNIDESYTVNCIVKTEKHESDKDEKKLTERIEQSSGHAYEPTKGNLNLIGELVPENEARANYLFYLLYGRSSLEHSVTSLHWATTIKWKWQVLLTLLSASSSSPIHILLHNSPPARIIPTTSPSLDGSLSKAVD